MAKSQREAAPDMTLMSLSSCVPFHITLLLNSLISFYLAFCNNPSALPLHFCFFFTRFALPSSLLIVARPLRRSIPSTQIPAVNPIGGLLMVIARSR